MSVEAEQAFESYLKSRLLWTSQVIFSPGWAKKGTPLTSSVCNPRQIEKVWKLFAMSTSLDGVFMQDCILLDTCWFAPYP